MFKKQFSHTITIFQALLVTFLWSTSFIIIKWGLAEIPPLTFAGLRYALAFLCLLPFVLTKQKLEGIKRLRKKDWLRLIFLGILFYSFTQGAQFVGLSLLPAVTVSLMLNFTPVVVAVMGIFLIAEKPSLLQWSGVIFFVTGILIYFFPVLFSADQALGLGVMIIGIIANAGSAILGRSINREGIFHPIVVTVISMGIGSFILLFTGIITEGLPNISPTNWYYLIWLAAINTAFAFTLWNLTLRSLTAMESSIINGTMLIQIAILAWIFIDEPITLKEGIGMIIAGAGVVIVQLRRKKNNS